MSDRQCARAVVVLAVLCIVLMVMNATARAHTPDEQAGWWADWHTEVRMAGGITPGLLAEATEFIDRHTAEPATAGDRGTSNLGGGPEQWRALVAAYFPGHAVNRMLCLMRYESGGNPSARNPSSGASGLLQVMPFWADHYGVARQALFDPDTNLRIARLVWDEQGYRAWSPYKRGLCR
jgi:hypothetical protein